MGKILEHIQRDDHGLAQWIMRKLVNHDPMSKRDSASGAKKSKGKKVYHNEGTQEVYYRTAGERTFKIEVTEITGDDEAALIAIAAQGD